MKAHHEERTGSTGGLLYLLQFFEREAQWFFNKDVFAGLESSHHLAGMRGMTRGNQYRVDIGIIQDLACVGRRVFKIKFISGAGGRHPHTGNDGLSPL